MQGWRGRGEAENGQFQEKLYFLFRPLLKALKSMAEHMKKKNEIFFLGLKDKKFSGTENYCYYCDSQSKYFL